MASSAILLLGLFVSLVAATFHQDGVVGDRDYLNKQQTIAKLLHRVHQPNMYQDLAEIGNNYDFEQNYDKYQNVEIVKQFMKQYHKGCLPRGMIFSVLNQKDLEEMVLLYQVFYYAKDYETFFKTACWARDRINAEQFVYALTTAVFHRQDTKGVVLPPIYEVLPHFFFNSQVIKQAYEAKMRQENVVIQMNNTRYMKNADQKVAYYSEDLALNQFYSNWNKRLPFWYSQQFGPQQERKGELFYYLHQQLLARYDFERISNDLPTIEALHFNQQIKHGYSPRLSYRQGMDFPMRPDYMMVADKYTYEVVSNENCEGCQYNVNDRMDVNGQHDVQRNMHERRVHHLVNLQDVEDYERRVREAIDSGYVVVEGENKIQINNEQGIDVLGRIVQGNKKVNKQYYGSYKNMAHKLLGQVTDAQKKYGVPPSVLEHFETSVRDPLFYSFHKRINNLFRKHKNHLPYYTQQQLEVPGVKVTNVDLDRLITYFEDYVVDLTNAVDINTNENVQEVDIKARTKRINHKPFNLKVEVQSDKTKTVLMRIFLAPKYNFYGQQMPLEKMRHYMVELDKFPVQLTSGQNVIERQSKEFTSIVPDHSYFHLKNLVQNVAVDQENFVNGQKLYSQCGMPEHLLLPKGKVGGLPVTLAVVMTDYETNNADIAEYQEPFIFCGTKDLKYPDNKPMGYPFDRQIHQEEFFVPNIYFKDTTIYHKRESSDVNRSTNM